ncbi:SDR family oxidoreductase [Paenarthrobacter sp. Z7-10]|uniref:SDR family NAD(P)-dependent oxidoreductase n=1 Tax=Paenarthrobacter sp. Z7-10 TaxID=2787635 RepID=UPI0022A93140|nr:SDR family oxidoreductase [Paenarthrobacter sp. Z7-10]MCZ2401651.1 SDR family oxidoreductase [Paenarthrobacter sp. Z7-10]
MVNFGLDGKQILVTGAGRGLGRAIADALTGLGATVYGTSRTAAGAQAIAERLGTPAQVLDVAETASLATFVDELDQTSGGIDMLVNNAGINIPKPATTLTENDWDSVFGTNLKGPFFLSTALARSWLTSGRRGAIVNIASQAGMVAIEDRAAYGTSKAGLIHLTKSLALEWAAAGIRVNAVAPTFVRTELTESTLSQPGRAAELLDRIPLGRFGEPEDIVGAVAFLLGDAAALITGHTLTIDGGYTIH